MAHQQSKAERPPKKVWGVVRRAFEAQQQSEAESLAKKVWAVVAGLLRIPYCQCIRLKPIADWALKIDIVLSEIPSLANATLRNSSQYSPLESIGCRSEKNRFPA